MKKTLLLLSALVLALAVGTAYAAEDHFVAILEPGSAVYDIGPYGSPGDGLSVAARGMGVWALNKESSTAVFDIGPYGSLNDGMDVTRDMDVLALDRNEFVTVINLGAGPGLTGIIGSAAGGLSKGEDNFVTIISDTPITFD